MISTNVMSFMKKIVKAGDDEVGGAGGATGASGAGGASASGTIGKLRQTMASGMKEIRDKTAAPLKSPPPPGRGDLGHLTDEEKSILHQVWKKEAEFEKEAIQKKAKPPGASAAGAAAAPAGPQTSRRKGPAACRICRKSMTPDEPYYTCVECGQGVCDDCASYRKDSSQEETGWKCSFCRRRQDRLGVEHSAGAGMRRVPSSQKVSTEPALVRQHSGDHHEEDLLKTSQKHPAHSERLRRGSSETSNAENTLSTNQSQNASEHKRITDTPRKESLPKSPPNATSAGSISGSGNTRSPVHQTSKPETQKTSSSQRQDSQGSQGRKMSGGQTTVKTDIRESSGSQGPLSPKSSHSASQPTHDRLASRASTPKQGAQQGHVVTSVHETDKTSQAHRQGLPTTKVKHPTTSVSPRTASQQNRVSSPTEKKMSSDDSRSDRKDYIRSSRPGSPVPERLQDKKVKPGTKPSLEKSRVGDGDRIPGQSAQVSPSHSRRDSDMSSKHSSLEAAISTERRPSMESLKGLRVSPQPPSSPVSSPATRQYHLRMSSASESSMEDKSPPEDDAERRRRNRMRRRSRFQRQKTFIDERDSDGRCAVEEWPSTGTNGDSSFDSSSAFESFDNDGADAKHAHISSSPYSGRSMHHIGSDVSIYQRRRSSDSSDISDISSEMAGYGERPSGGYRSDHIPHSRRHPVAKSVSPRRPQLTNRGTSSDYEAHELRYNTATSIDLTSGDDRMMLRNRMEKSVSVDDPDMMGSRMSSRRSDISDDRRRIFPQEYTHGMPHSSTSSAYAYASADPRFYHGQQQSWSRSARSLEISMDMAAENRKPSITEGEGIKIIIDDVDADRKGYRSQSTESRGLRRNSHEKAERPIDWNDRADWSYDDGFDTTARSLNISSRHKASSASDVSSESDYHQSSGSRRRLPMIPVTSACVVLLILRALLITRLDQVCHGDVGLQIWYDPDEAELMITILAAKGLKKRKSSVGSLPRAYARLRILPYSGFRPIKTVVAEATGNPEWNKTCVFQGITMDEILEKVLEVSIWDMEHTEDTQILLGVANIPLRRVDLKNVLEWYPLTSRHLTLLTSPHKASSTGMLVSTPAHDMARRLLTRATQREMLQSQSLTDDGQGECYDADEDQGMVKSTSMDSSLIPPEDNWDRMCTDEAERDVPMFDQAQNVQIFPDEMPHRQNQKFYPFFSQDSLPEMYCSDIEQTDWQRNISYDRRCVNSDTEAVNDVMYRQRGRNSLIRRRGTRDSRTESGARSVVLVNPSIETEESLEAGNKPSSSKKAYPSLVKTLGPETCVTAPSTKNLGRSKLGELKLGLLLQRGQLNVEVIKARGIQHSANGHAPDTYVKTYLKDGEGKGIKRKTSVVRQSMEPKFHQTLKYVVADQRHKTLCAMLWERHKRFEHNQPIGMVALDLGKIKLTKPFTRWYNLLPLVSADTESVGSS